MKKGRRRDYAFGALLPTFVYEWVSSHWVLLLIHFVGSSICFYIVNP